MYNFLLLILVAVLPALVIVFYVYWQDSLKREPIKWILKGVFFGFLSVLLTFVVDGVVSFFYPLPDFYSCTDDAFQSAFFGAALPEEACKLLMLWLLLRKNPYFDEHMDGPVYAVCVGMGFAALENITYLLTNYDAWVSVGVSRAVFSIPGHAFFAMFMGYYFSLWYFKKEKKTMHAAMMYLVPVALHTFYDFVLMESSVYPLFGLVVFIIILVLFHRLRKRSLKMMAELKAADVDMNNELDDVQQRDINDFENSSFFDHKA